MNRADALRVLIIADDPLTRAGLASLLSERSDHTVAGQMAAADLPLMTTATLPQGTAPLNPDVLLWDMGWASAAALEQLATIDDVPAPVVALIQDGGDAPAAWSSGARGIFLRSTRIEQVLIALPPIVRGLVVLDPALSEALISPREARSALPADALTARETEVLQYLAQGLANKVIARRMNIAESTVKFHINAILGKLGAQSRTDAVVRATRMGLVVL
jgi:DNA-binding NarL/FixJ family response regulator